MLFPPLDHWEPTTHSSWPPVPEYCRGPMVSAFTWPVRVRSPMALLMETTWSFWAMFRASFPPVDLLLAEGGVVIGKAPQLRPAHHVGVYAPPRAGLFAAVVHHAPAHQLHDAGAQDLRVDAQIPLSRVGQALPHGVGQPPQAQLEAGAVRHQVRDVARDAAVRLVPRGDGRLHQRRLDSMIPSTSETWERVWASPSLG